MFQYKDIFNLYMDLGKKRKFWYDKIIKGEN